MQGMGWLTFNAYVSVWGSKLRLVTLELNVCGLLRLVGRIAGLKRGFTIHESRACAGQGAMLIVPSRKHKTRQAKHDALNHENVCKSPTNTRSITWKPKLHPVCDKCLPSQTELSPSTSKFPRVLPCQPNYISPYT